MPIEFTIHGQPPSKSNSYKIGKPFGGGRPNLYKTKELKRYEEYFLFQIPSKYRDAMIENDLAIDLICYFSSRRPDLGNAEKAICDCLQEGGVVKNDRQFSEIHLYKKLDKEKPRALIRIYRPK